MKISIIVPVYKVEEFIVKCVSSLMNQDYDDYEVIVVDDGSPDRSIEIMQHSIQSDKIRIIRQENQGLSGARNTGLKDAKGEYVWFVDSDDWVEENCLTGLMRVCEGYDVVALTSFIKEGDWDASCKDFVVNKVSSGIELCYEKHLTGAPFFIYRRKFLLDNNLFFEQGILHEDTLFTPQMLYRCQRLGFYETPIYHYLKRKNSITTNVNPKRCDDLLYIIAKLDNFNHEVVKPEHRRLFCSVIANYICDLWDIAAKLPNEYQEKVNKHFQSNRHLLRNLIHCVKKTTRIMGYVTILIPIKVLSIYKLLKKIK